MFYVVFVIVALCCSQILGFNSQNTSVCISLMPKPETSQILSPPPFPYISGHYSSAKQLRSEGHEARQQKKKRIKDARSDGMTLQEKYRPALCCASLRTYCRVFLTFPPPLQTSSFFFLFFLFFFGGGGSYVQKTFLLPL